MKITDQQLCILKTLEKAKGGLTISGIEEKTGFTNQYVLTTCRIMRTMKDPIIKTAGDHDVCRGRKSNGVLYVLTKRGSQFLKDYVPEVTNVEQRYKAILQQLSDGKKYSSKELAKLLSVAGTEMSADCSTMYERGLIERVPVQDTVLGAIQAGNVLYDYLILKKGRDMLAGRLEEVIKPKPMNKKIQTPFALGAMFGSTSN